MSCARRSYPSDLNDLQWQRIKKFIPLPSHRGRPRGIVLRRVVNAMFYVNRTGCAWRYLPASFPPWQTVYWYYSRWSENGVLRRIHDALVGDVRVQAQKDPAPSALIIDSQSIKCRFGERRGFDAFKKVRGRKRNIVVDTLGLIHGLRVDGANIKDHSSGAELLRSGTVQSSVIQAKPLKMFMADGGYKAHEFQNEVQKQFQIWPTLKSGVGKRNNRHVRVLTESNLKPTRWVV